MNRYLQSAPDAVDTATGLRIRKPAIKETLARVLVVDVGYFPRVEAPSMTVPRGTLAATHAISATREALESLDLTLTRVAEKFGMDVPVSNHPYFGGLSVRQWQKFHWRHTLHHMKQVSRRRSALLNADAR